MELTETVYKAIDELHKSMNHPNESSNNSESSEGFYFVDVKAHLAKMHPNEKYDHFKVESSLTYLYWSDLLYSNKDITRFSLRKIGKSY